MEPPGGRRSFQEIVSAILADLDRGGVLTDTNPGSVIRTLVEAFGCELAESYAQLARIYDMGFVDTAEGAALDRLVALLGVHRVDGAAARGTVVLHRDPRLSSRVVIPEGTEIRFDNVAAGKSVIYATADAGEIPAGAAETSVEIFAAIGDGVDPDAVLLDAADVEHAGAQMVAPIAGVAGVGLAAPTAVRGLRENDEELRSRVKGAVEAAGGGSHKAIERAVLETGHATAVRLRDATSEDRQPPLRPGELEVVTDAELGNPVVLRDIERAVQATKGPGILVHLRPVERLELRIRLRLKPVDRALGAAGRQTLRGRAEQRVRESLIRFQVGEGLVWNRWLADLLGIEGVLDVDAAGSSFELGEQAPATPGDLTVGKLQRLVLADAPDALAVEVADERTLHVRLDLTIPSAPAGTDRQGAEADVAAAFRGALDAANGEAIDRILELVKVKAAVQNKLTFVTLAPEHVSLDVFSVDDQAIAELRHTASRTFQLEDTDVLRPDPDGPTIRWPQ